MDRDEAKQVLQTLTREQQRLLFWAYAFNTDGPYRQKTEMPVKLGTWCKRSGRWYFNSTKRAEHLGYWSSRLGPLIPSEEGDSAGDAGGESDG